MKYIWLSFLIIFVLCMYTSCSQDASKDRMTRLVKEWERRQVVYPSETTPPSFLDCGCRDMAFLENSKTFADFFFYTVYKY